MSDPNTEPDADRPTISGTDLDMNLGDGRKMGAADEDSDSDSSDDDRVDIEDLP